MRRFAVAAIVVAAFHLAGCDGGAGDSSPPPSIVLITIDTLRADRLGVYGHAGARTPVIDALARRGVRFEAATTPFPRTTPALASMMTGLLPWRHGSREVGQPMAATLATLPSMLDARGYITLGVSVNGAAGRAQNLHLGFDRFLDYQSFADHTAAGVTDATIALVEETLPAGAPTTTNRVSPFLLWVHYIDPHFPYAPPETWRDQPEGRACRDLVTRTGSDLVATAHVRIDLGGEASTALADCEALYDAEIAFTDFHVGRLLDALETRGLLARAYVVFTSDHGENLGEDGLFYEHGPSVHDSSLRVPLLVAGPGIEPRVDRAIARLEDLTPTLLALARVPSSEWPAFDGMDLSSRLLTGGETSPGSAIAESGGALLPETFLYLASGHPGDRQCINGSRFSLCVDPGGEPRLYDHVADPFLEHDVSARHPDVMAALLAVKARWPAGQARERTLRTALYKLVERPRPQGGWRPELYDLEADPGETRDLAAERPELTERLRGQLDAAFAAVEPPRALELEPRELEALRALGYLR
ncbi:MAG TPA: sulfatase [Thermoanaerobaculia bacterium]|nr:sulfatase [Thermoanaerobaculia bacterium]